MRGAPRQNGNGKYQLAAIVGDRKSRQCLRCERLFRSNGPGNRICSPCADYLSKHIKMPKLGCDGVSGARGFRVIRKELERT